MNDAHTPGGFLDEAIRLSIENVRENLGGPFGAVVVRDGEIIGSGRNAVTTAHDPTAHAEIVAIRAACRGEGSFELPGCVLYSSCEPCPMCLAACYWARLDAVYFAATMDDAAVAGFDDAFLYREMAVSRDERTLPVRAIPERQQTAIEAFDLWQASQTKVEY